MGADAVFSATHRVHFENGTVVNVTPRVALLAPGGTFHHENCVDAQKLLNGPKGKRNEIPLAQARAKHTECAKCKTLALQHAEAEEEADAYHLMWAQDRWDAITALATRDPERAACVEQAQEETEAAMRGDGTWPENDEWFNHLPWFELAFARYTELMDSGAHADKRKPAPVRPAEPKPLGRLDHMQALVMLKAAADPEAAVEGDGHVLNRLFLAGMLCRDSEGRYFLDDAGREWIDSEDAPEETEGEPEEEPIRPEEIVPLTELTEAQADILRLAEANRGLASGAPEDLHTLWEAGLLWVDGADEYRMEREAYEWLRADSEEGEAAEAEQEVGGE